MTSCEGSGIFGFHSSCVRDMAKMPGICCFGCCCVSSTARLVSNRLAVTISPGSSHFRVVTTSLFTRPSLTGKLKRDKRYHPSWTAWCCEFAACPLLYTHAYYVCQASQGACLLRKRTGCCIQVMKELDTEFWSSLLQVAQSIRPLVGSTLTSRMSPCLPSCPRIGHSMRHHR